MYGEWKVSRVFVDCECVKELKVSKVLEIVDVCDLMVYKELKVSKMLEIVNVWDLMVYKVQEIANV